MGISIVGEGKVVIIDGPNADFVVDMATDDLIDSDDGWFLESADARTPIYLEARVHLNRWWGDAKRGSRIAELLKQERPTNTREILDEVKRFMQHFVDISMIEDLRCTEDVDVRSGKPCFLIEFFDHVAGMPNSLTLTP